MVVEMMTVAMNCKMEEAISTPQTLSSTLQERPWPLQIPL